MLELFYEALRITSIGVIILDHLRGIVFFNNAIEKLCNISEKHAIGRKIEDVLPVFADAQYKNMIEAVLMTGQSRFCSGALHKSFVFPKGEDRNARRQNMKIEFIPVQTQPYVAIQIIDLSEFYNNEQRLQERICQLKKGYDDLKFTKIVTERLAKYDSLTGLLNRYYFEIKFNDLLKETIEKDEALSIAFIDLDGFKKINDTLGHMVGDALLQMVASRIKNNLKKRDFAMRMGGDEFVVALKNVYSPAYTEKVASDMLAVLKKPYYIDNQVVSISASIGISNFPQHAKTLGELIDKADKAMYCVKESGKSKVLVYGETI